MTAAQIAAAVIPRASGRDRANTTVFTGFMFGALALAFLGLGAIVYDFSSDGLPIVSWDFVTSFPSRIRPENAGVESAIVGTIYLMIICAVLVVPIGIMTAIYLEEYADAEPLVEPADRDQHPEPLGRPLGRLRHPRAGLHRARAAGPRAGAAGGRDHARTARAAGRDHRRARGDPRRAAVDPRGLAGARRDAVADDLEAGATGLDRRHPDRRHPRAVARDRRDGAAAGHRRRGLVALQPHESRQLASRRCRSRSSPGRRTPIPIS